MKEKLMTVGTCLLLATCAISQVTQEVLAKKKIATIKCRFTKSSIDTTVLYTVDLSFQNLKYKEITDLASINLNYGVALDGFIADLDTLRNFAINRKNNTSKFFKTRNYQLSIETKLNLLYIQDAHGRYTMISMGQTQKLIDWLRTLQLPQTVSKD